MATTRTAVVQRRVGGGLLDPRMLLTSLPDAVRKLDPRLLWRKPVMFIVEAGSVLSTWLAVRDNTAFAWWITGWLWATVVFANLAEAVAEGRGKAQAATLRKARTETIARRLPGWAPGRAVTEEEVPATGLRVGDHVVVEAGQLIPGDGDVVEGVASVDESAITGESAPVIRESGGDRSAVTGGTKVLSDRIVVRITSKPGETFIDRMIALVEGASRQKTPNEIALNILLASLTIVFLLAVATLQPLAIYSHAEQSLIILVALLVCLIPTTIGALLSAIGIAGMDRLVQRNVLAMSGRAVEAAGDVNTLLLDKTGTITLGNRQATDFLAVGGTDEAALADAAQLSSLADETRKAGPSLSWPRPATGCGNGTRASSRIRCSCRSPRRPGCPVSTSTVTLDPVRSARAPSPRSPPGCGNRAAPSRRRPGSWWTPSPPREALRCSWPSASTAPPGRLVSCSSRTSSRPAPGNGSPRCARWASAPS
jgi:potassium-transporting ATPase ATP-binding subunit